MQKNVRAGLAVAAALSTVLGIAGVALADDPYPSKQQVQDAKDNVAAKKDSLAEVRKQLAAAESAAEEAGEKAEIAAEKYNGAMWKLNLAKKAVRKAERRAEAAHRRVVHQRDGIARLVVNSFQDGTRLNTMSAMLGGGGPEDVMAKTGVVSAAGDSLNADYHRFLTLSDRADAAEKKAEQARSRAAGIATAARSERAAAAAAVARAQALSDQVQATRNEVVKALAKAEHTSIALAEERQRALEEIARKKAAAKARKEAAKKAAEAAAQAAQDAASDSDSDDASSSTPTTDVEPTSAAVAKVIAYARAQLGKPYLWAADGPSSFDCSGLTMMAWRQAGVYLPHYSRAQYDRTTPVAISEARPGDLLFWTYNGSPSGIHHVALYIGGGTFIEAPHTGANVRYNTLDNFYPDFAGRL